MTDKKSLKQIKIIEINSIYNLDKFIINFITENELNLCIIRFSEKDLIRLYDVHNTINEHLLNIKYINNEENKKNKIFIILIHITRTNDFNFKDIKQNNIINDYYISFLSTVNHYFIDNINNKNNNFLKIINSTNQEILSSILEQDNVLLSKLEKGFRFFKYILFNIQNRNKEKNIINIIDNYFDNVEGHNIEGIN